MKIEVQRTLENKLMKRSESVLTLDHSGKPTPSRPDVLKEVVKVLKAKEDAIIIDRITTKPGRGLSEIKVFVYQKKEDIPKHKLEKMERRTKKKEKPEEGKPGGETPGTSTRGRGP